LDGPSLRLNAAYVDHERVEDVVRLIDGDPESLEARVDGGNRGVSFRGGVVSVATGGLRAGSHVLVLTVADFQETKNNENVARILPNTRTLRLSFRVS
jgi:hypothetical protein